MSGLQWGEFLVFITLTTTGHIGQIGHSCGSDPMCPFFF